MGLFKSPKQVQNKVLSAARKTPPAAPGLTKKPPPGMQRKSAPRSAVPAPSGMMRQGMREGQPAMMDPNMAEGGKAKKKPAKK